MVMVSGAYSKVYPTAAVTDIPYTFFSAPVAWKVLDGQFSKDLGEHGLKQTGLRTFSD